MNRQASELVVGADEIGARQLGAGETGAGETGADETGADETGADEKGADETQANETRADDMVLLPEVRGSSPETVDSEDWARELATEDEDKQEEEDEQEEVNDEDTERVSLVSITLTSTHVDTYPIRYFWVRQDCFISKDAGTTPSR